MGPYLDAALTGQPPVAADCGALRRETAPVWEMVEAIIRGGQAYAPGFYILLAVAGLIGAVGLITKSQVLIVAAMVVWPGNRAKPRPEGAEDVSDHPGHL